MRKYLLLLIILVVGGCSFNKEENTTLDNDNIYEEDNIIEEVEAYQDDNPIKLGLFLYDNNYSNKERLEDTYYTNFTSGVDIGSFEVFLTDNKVI